ncbi:cobalamin biosynthesis protein CobQ [Bifidobacterium callitrichidarum]|uniref:Cobalamin biosynthesis protein CobQ n=1 Tax=Bifidobacterium callitrichidarum TaxID=2052941 RepID=A0A2U2NC50_9BIFI|nr:cobalamin biosynthesis protein CobQ [Bifidobacterium callitrichidarum]
MVALIIGGGNLLGLISQRIPEKRWRVPSGGDIDVQAKFLADHPAPQGRGYVFVDQPGNWMMVSQAGWRVYWCDASQVPVGCLPLPDQILNHSVNDLTQRFWNQSINDKRLVGDVLLGREDPMGVLICVTSMSGGVGKTVTSRRLCERAAEMGVPSLLVDGNMLQSSQRSFFDPERRMNVRSIADWRKGQKATMGANPGKRFFNVEYDISFAPPTGVTVPWQQYLDYVEEARKRWQFIVVDLDRISAADLDDPSTAAGALIVPWVRSGDLVLFSVKAGLQTQADAMAVFQMLPSHGLPQECIGIKDSIPAGMPDSDYTQYDYSDYGIFFGAERQTTKTGELIAAGQSNWPDPELDWVREKVLDWALPDRGFDPEQFEPKRKKKGGLFGWLKK